MHEQRAWFLPKRYGYGAGLPVAWQGWALLAGLLVPALAGWAAHRLLAVADHRLVPIVTAATIAYAVMLMPIAARRTRGGWRWRWGDRD